MSELNEDQKRMAETLDGMLVVDAGPGTGKTKTIVDRYINLISQEGVSPTDVLLLTFTRNAAEEMKTRIMGALTALCDDGDGGDEWLSKSRLVRVQTFDSFCLSIVMDSPDLATSMFGIEEKLTHSVKMVSNESVSRQRFLAFLDGFIQDNLNVYGRWTAVANEFKDDLYDLINCLLTKGIYPLSNGWFGGRNGKELYGDPDCVYNLIWSINEKGPKGGKSVARNALKDAVDNIGGYSELPSYFEKEFEIVPEQMLKDAAYENRDSLIAFVHDVYHAYIRDCVTRDCLTFGIASMMAFSVLYNNKAVRERNRFRYIMIDEFQDTNAAQIMMSLMILEKPNLCVVGDWKQGIYGFRHVSIEFIRDFTNKVNEIREQLNEDGIERVLFEIPEPCMIPFTFNYRSSQLIVDHAFNSLYLKATKKEKLNEDELRSKITLLKSMGDPMYSDATEVRFVQAPEKTLETDAVERCIREYIGSDKYPVRSMKDGRIEERRMRLGDIAVLCRTVKGCRAVVDHLESHGIHAYLHGDLEIMATREGKLVLAWLRYMSNDHDPRGICAIMADLGYGIDDCYAVSKKPELAPVAISSQKKLLRSKRLRTNELLTSIFEWYGISNDISQTIVNVLSDLHRGSMMTISDLIEFIEEDLSGGKRSAYTVDGAIGTDAVAVMTMHKAKGLEFPTVIIPYIDTKTVPLSNSRRSVFRLDGIAGLRCSHTVFDFGGYSKIVKSWKTDLIGAATSDSRHKDGYDEERRLLFVAMSRAKQYETLISGPEPSFFMTGLCDDPQSSMTIERLELDSEHTPDVVSEKPDLSGYGSRVTSFSVHELLKLDFENVGEGAVADEVAAEGRGKEYGTKVHEEADRMHTMGIVLDDYPESRWIAENVLSRIRSPWGRGDYATDYVDSFSEQGCTLPLDDPKVVVRGIIDLLIVFEDRVEVHDYKTDGSKANQGEYELQLSVYAHVVKRVYPNLPVRCFIDYAYLGETIEFDPLPFERIEERVREASERSVNGE